MRPGCRRRRRGGPPRTAAASVWAGKTATIGASRPVAHHMGSANSQDGTRWPHGRVSRKASAMTAASISTVSALSAIRELPSRRSALPSGMPMRLPAIQAIFSVRYGTQAASVVTRSTVRVVRAGAARVA
ncbi:hypothetical protein [Streptomyces lydicus]|uniref:hypothetical protein n=1 Tax=Streptomyces lydicus TaxID=47763 RepID=UPI00378EA182